MFSTSDERIFVQKLFEEYQKQKPKFIKINTIQEGDLDRNPIFPYYRGTLTINQANKETDSEEENLRKKGIGLFAFENYLLIEKKSGFMAFDLYEGRIIKTYRVANKLVYEDNFTNNHNKISKKLEFIQDKEKNIAHLFFYNGYDMKTPGLTLELPSTIIEPYQKMFETIRKDIGD